MGRFIFFMQFSLATLIALICGFLVNAEDPYRFYTWNVTYGTLSPLGVAKMGILVNGQFPGPPIEAVTNDNILVNVFNNLNESILFTWNGVKQRKTSWQDGVLGTNCPIPPNTNWTYKFQLKDQIGTYNYFLSTQLHRADGGFGAINIASRSIIDIPYLIPSKEFTVLVSDWYNSDHKNLQKFLDSGRLLPRPDGLLINGDPRNGVFTGEKGKTYKFRISNVGIATSINFRIQSHSLTLVEVEGAHTLQEVYESLDVHVGQSVAVLVTLNANVRDYVIIASSRFTSPIYYNTTATLRYAGSNTPASNVYPIGPTYHIHWSMKQARTIRLNLTANAARPNPQGSYHYGTIPVVDRLIVVNKETTIKNKLRYAVNGISYVDPTTPLKVADWYNISDVFHMHSIKGNPVATNYTTGTRVITTTLHDFVEIVFQNNEKTVQSWHLDGNSVYVVGYGSGQWNSSMTKRYNLIDAIARHTYQVYPESWTAVLVSLDNKGMWNLRSAIWANRYLGQQLYVRVWNDEPSVYTEDDPPSNILYCGKFKKPSS
ncbi:hypothetical protein ACFE04_024215 [Oxalis oulophora]